LAGARTEDVVTDEEALHLLALESTLEFPPGSAHVYSNSGYFLLSLVVQRSSGQSLADYARVRIFAPLGMEQTRYVHDHTSIVAGHAVGYALARGGGFRLDSSNWEQNGDGGLQTTVGQSELAGLIRFPLRESGPSDFEVRSGRTRLSFRLQNPATR
jgi:CubicO group peptidase (beta-lactamase class C family)